MNQENEMRIAHLCQAYPPMINGQAVTTKKLAEGLGSRGHEVFVFAASDLGAPYESAHPGLKICREKSYNNLTRVGQRIFIWPYASLIQALSLFKPDIIHVQDPLLPALLGIKAKRALNIPAVLTTHQVPSFISAHLPTSFSVDKRFENILWKYAKWNLAHFEGIVAPTETVSTLISTRTGYHVETISNGIDLDIFRRNRYKSHKKRSLREIFGLHPDKPVILHVGQINSEKKVDIAVKAALRVMNNTMAQLLVVGDGYQLNSIKRICAGQGLMDDCHFTGYVYSREKLAELYSMSNIFITGSTIETQGIVLLEAAASGLPIVAVDATCIPELVHDNKNGYLVPINDVNAMAIAIGRIIESETLGEKMGQASRKIAFEHDFNYSLNKYESFYKHILNDFPSNKSDELLNLETALEANYPHQKKARDVYPEPGIKETSCF